MYIYIYIYCRALSKSWLVVENVRDCLILFSNTHGLCPQHPPGVRKPLHQAATELQFLLEREGHTHARTRAHTHTLCLTYTTATVPFSSPPPRKLE